MVFAKDTVNLSTGWEIMEEMTMGTNTLTSDLTCPCQVYSTRKMLNSFE